VRRSILAVSLAWLAVLGPTTIARADDDAAVATATALLEEGQKLALAGNCQGAIEKFRASLEALRSVGALLNYADCAEKLGRTATAWTRFQEAHALALRKKDDRAAYAATRADALAPRLSRLIVNAPSLPEDGSVSVDGVTFVRGALGSATPLDPGPHAIEASAPGRLSFHRTVVLTDPGTTTIDVPVLASAPSTTIASPAVTHDVDAPLGTRKTIALVVGGVGLASIGAGVWFGLRARSKWNDASNACTDVVCPGSAVSEGKDAQRAGTASTIFLVSGLGVLAGATVLWLTAPDAKTTVAPDVGKSHAGVMLRASF
jgi:hypothetical protein